MKRTATWEEREKPVKIVIETKVPTKWLFVDRETGDVWRWRDGKLVRA